MLHYLFFISLVFFRRKYGGGVRVKGSGVKPPPHQFSGVIQPPAGAKPTGNVNNKHTGLYVYRSIKQSLKISLEKFKR